MTRAEFKMEKIDDLALTNYKACAYQNHYKQDENANSTLEKIMAAYMTDSELI